MKNYRMTRDVEFSRNNSNEPSRYFLLYRDPTKADSAVKWEAVDIISKMNLVPQLEPYFGKRSMGEQGINHPAKMHWVEVQQKRWPKGKPKKKETGLQVWASKLAGQTRLRRRQAFDISCIAHASKLREENGIVNNSN